ncbi:6-phosphogluconate dehydrogenase C-terminal domain-like protein [Lentinula aciculospora]|uniref:6-phosphogluconate dehydrogenase C-terminal domain-like protein n=1 Tax=Lentinula aciculospora TaxID=153920 RepID=A0A9W8ZYF3_9AGAR|nr:6-phosphogluconate dehydrogenase C-terminal domain-like protein [Lentinula aciculospora]
MNTPNQSDNTLAPTPTIAVIGAGAMGSQLAHRLYQSGAGPILTNLEGRSPMTCKRAVECGMKDASYVDIVCQADYILSVVPPKDALAIAKIVADTVKISDTQSRKRTKTIFVDCNAINPTTARQMAKLFVETSATFIDGAIVGGPPSDVYNPGLYICADPEDDVQLNALEEVLRKYGLQPFTLKGEGAGIGDASAVKMANSGIVKGAIALFTSMILASHASSPSTSQGLIHSLHISQSTFIDQMIRLVPQMTPKAYRFVGEMEEVARFTEDEGLDGVSCIYEGAAQVFQRIADAHNANGKGMPKSGGPVDCVNRQGEESKPDDIDVILKVIEDAKTLWARDRGKSWAPTEPEGR